MAYSPTTHTGDGIVDQYSIGFDFVASSHVGVFLDDVAQASGWQFANSNTEIRFDTAPGSGVEVKFTRTTPSALVVNFVSGAQVTRDNLDKAFNQALYYVEEQVYAAIGPMLKDGVSGQWDAETLRITELVDPVNDQDAATKVYSDANIAVAAGHAAAAAASAATTTADAISASSSAGSSATSAATAGGHSISAQSAKNDAESARDAVLNLVPTPGAGGEGERLYVNDTGTAYEARQPSKAEVTASSDQTLTAGVEALITSLNDIGITNANGTRDYLMSVVVPCETTSGDTDLIIRVRLGANGDITDPVYRTIKGNTRAGTTSFQVPLTSPAVGSRVSLTAEYGAGAGTIDLQFASYFGGIFIKEQ